MDSVTFTPQVITQDGAVLLATDHDRFDYELIADNARLMVDSGGRYRKERGVTWSRPRLCTKSRETQSPPLER